MSSEQRRPRLGRGTRPELQLLTKRSRSGRKPPRAREDQPVMSIGIDLPSPVPVTGRELDVLERHLGAALERLLGS